MEDNNKDKESKEISLEELENVTGGAGLRRVKKEKTYDISEDTKSKI